MYLELALAILLPSRNNRSFPLVAGKWINRSPVTAHLYNRTLMPVIFDPPQPARKRYRPGAMRPITTLGAN